MQRPRELALPIRRAPRRVAMLSVHTSPLDQPGIGDAGGMNVLIAEVARRLAERDTQVEVFTRATSADQPLQVEMAPGVLVHNVRAGPPQRLAKADLPSQLCAMAAGVLRHGAARPQGWYDLIHSHYWLSGQVGWLAKERWGVPLAHTAHTLGRVKNRSLAPGDLPEPILRIVGEQQVVDAADRLIANTATERDDLIALYDADPDLVDVALPGVDLGVFHPYEAVVRAATRARLGWRPDDLVVLFVGRIQPLKAPDLLVRAIAGLPGRDPEIASRVRLVVCGGPSGPVAAADEPTPQPTAPGGAAAYAAGLADLAAELGVRATFHPAAGSGRLRELYASADLVAMPSHSESFGLVALEAQACGTPVLAADVGGLPVAVADGRSGLLVDGHDPAEWTRALQRILADDPLRVRLAAGARAHAATLSWDATAEAVLTSYRAALASRRESLWRAG